MATAYLRSLAPGLPRHVWILQAGMAVHTVGSGLVAPFVLIYLHSVRGFSLGTAGLVVGTHFAVAIVFGLVAGPLVDRIGGRLIAAGSLLLLAAGFGTFPLVHEPWHAFLLMAAAGVGRGAFWPSYSSLLAGLTPQDRMHASYGVQRVTGNLGLGLGALAGGLIATSTDPDTFAVLFLLNAAFSAVFLVALAFVPSPDVPPLERGEKRGTYRDVLRDRPFLGAIAVNAVFTAAGVALFNSMLPVFAKTEAGVSEDGIGLIFLVNTIVIVLVQLPVARTLEGRRRMPVLALVGGMWASCWLLTLASGSWLPAIAATIVLVFVGLIFGLGECLDGVIYGPLVADLAPARVRGRYMALWLITAQLGFAIGPAAGGFLLELSPEALWGTAAAVCLLTGTAALVLERGIPQSARRTPEGVDSAAVAA